MKEKNLRQVLAITVLGVMAISGTMGAHTSRRLTGSYFNAQLFESSFNVPVLMSGAAAGTTSTESDREVPRWWTVRSNSDVSTTWHFWSPAIPGIDNFASDTTHAESLFLILGPNQYIEAENVPLWRFKMPFILGGSAQVIARN